MKHTPLALTCALAAVWGTLPASSLANEPVVVLDPVVVTAAGFEQKIKEAPASISVITREALEKMPMANLGDAVRHLEGISIVGGSGGASDSDISVRGMPGQYTLILVDGKRQGSRETMSRGTGGVQSSFIPPKEAIERIEVVRGPMSSLYGSDAMGGVINIITRKMPKDWHGSFSVGGTLQKHQELGNATEAGFWIGGPLVQDVISLQLFGNYQQRNEDSVYYPKNSTAGNPQTRDSDYTAKLGIKPAANQDLVLEAGHELLSYARTPGKTLAAADATSSTRHERDHWAITHDGRWSFGSTRLALYQETATLKSHENGVESTQGSPKITNTTFDGQLTLPFDQHVLKLGGQYGKQALRGVGNSDTVAGHANNPESVNATTWAAYAEDQYEVTRALSLTGGLRVDHHSTYGAHTTPRLYAVYALTPKWTLRAGVASGFRAPSLRQTAAAYCMTTGGGTAKPGTLCGNPSLKAERSVTEEIGLRYDTDNQQNVSVTLFNNDFNDMVTSFDSGVVDPASPKRNLYVYDNIAKVNIRGVEFSGVYALAKDVKLSGKYTYTDSRRRDSSEKTFSGQSLNGQPLDKTPKHSLMAQLDWTLTEKAAVWMRGTASSKLYWAAFRNGAMGVRTRPASHSLDLGGSYAVTKGLSVNAALLNVTDKIVAVDPRSRAEKLDGNWMVDDGRRLWLTLNYQF